MSRRKAEPAPLSISRSKPARSPEARENQLISLAYDLAEQRLRDGTASSAEVVQLMKWGSRQTRLEQELTETKMELMKAKQAALESSMRMEEMFTDAMRQFRRYNGDFSEEVEEDENLY